MIYRFFQIRNDLSKPHLSMHGWRKQTKIGWDNFKIRFITVGSVMHMYEKSGKNPNFGQENNLHY